MAGDDRIRASDGEREQYAKMLRAAMAEGRLTLEEGEERLGQVYAARFRDELPPLTADLPDEGRRGLHETPEARDEFRRRARRGLAGHAWFVAAIAVGLTGLWLLSGAHFFWPAIPLFFLVFGLARHARWRRWAEQTGSWQTGSWRTGSWQRGSWQGHGGCGGRGRRNRWDRDAWAAHSDRTA